MFFVMEQEKRTKHKLENLGPPDFERFQAQQKAESQKFLQEAFEKQRKKQGD